MNRRIFLRFLSLPVILPLARKVQAAVDYLRPGTPTYVTLDCEILAPLCMSLYINGVERRRLILPVAGRKTYNIPVISMPPGAALTVMLHSAEPFRFFSSTMEEKRKYE